MKTAGEWKAERWEGEDWIITGFGLQHPGVFSKREADVIVAVLRSATPLVQEDAVKHGMMLAADLCISPAGEAAGDAEEMADVIRNAHDKFKLQ